METPEHTDDLGVATQLTIEGREALATGQPLRAVELLRRKHAIVINYFGNDCNFAATSGIDLGQALLQCGEYVEAAQLLNASLAIYRKLGTDDERLIRALSAAAMAAYQAADYASAEKQYVALIDELKGRGPSFDLSRAEEMDHLAQLYQRLGRHQDAERLCLEALGIFECLGSPHQLAVCLAGLGRAYFQMQRFRESEAVIRRELQLIADAGLEDSAIHAKALDHLAMSLVMRGQTERKADLAEEAVSHGARAVELFMRLLPPNHPSVIGSQQNLARYRHAAASIGKMFPGAKAEVAAGAANLPPNHPSLITDLIAAARDACAHRDIDRAIEILGEAKKQAIRAFGQESPLVLHTMAAKIEVGRRACSALLGEPTGILLPSEHVQMQMRAHARRGSFEDETAQPEQLPSARRRKVKRILEDALSVINELIAAATEESKTPRSQAAITGWQTGGHAGDALEVLHYARLFAVCSTVEASETAAAIMQLHLPTMGPGVSSSPLATGVEKSYQQLTQEYSLLVSEMVDRVLGRKRERAEIHGNAIEAIRARLDQLRKDINGRATSHGTGSAHQLLSVAQLQRRLGADTAAISYLLGSRAIFVLFVSMQKVSLIRVEFEEGLLAAACDTLRASCQIDARSGVVPTFEVAQAVSLYDLLISPVERHLESIQHLLVVPDGPLWSISFASLVGDLGAVESIEDGFDGVNDADPMVARMLRLRRAHRLQEESDSVYQLISDAEAWLGARYSISILPGLGATLDPSLVEKDHGVRKPFLGFGNPAFSPQRAIESLPETEWLLDQLAASLGADQEEDVIVGEAATVERIFAANESGELGARKVICFATHATYPTAEGDPLQEPSLMLAASQDGDTDLLRSSDVTRLTMNADVVLLTACFTAAPSGRQFTQPLSGLAQAFLNAGASSVLVSHWPTDSGATHAIVSEMFLVKSPGMSLAHAMQAAAKTVRALSSFAHPAYWAAYSIVGDGRRAIH